ncbi:MAG: hypothetical protein KDB02_09570 [Acidimicrobiales bacterium]|nr:hypothetical protein [Acidimicrobiales bacterium]
MKSTERPKPRLLNYIGQLRLYSAADLLLLLVAAGVGGAALVGALGLWFGFLVFLEWTHQDRGRLKWHWSVWASLWALAAVQVGALAWAAFAMVSWLYAQKKRLSWLSPASWIVNGGVKVALLLAAGVRSIPLLAGVWVVMAARNLAGDFRDVRKDGDDGVRSLPILLGVRQDVRWIYPLFLACSSFLWWWMADLPVAVLAVAYLTQMFTYGLTPR